MLDSQGNVIDTSVVEDSPEESFPTKYRG